ncbi:hypothetical protein [Rhizobium leguminosarum]|uniref:hypothetical protein n=1 Tax=Rhizobium leguminosarum TaxID=384 RepID=UPI003F95C691
MVDVPRISRPETSVELERLLSRVYPEAIIEHLDAEQAQAQVRRLEPKMQAREDLIAGEDNRALVALVTGRDGIPTSGKYLLFDRSIDRHALRFGRFLMRVFNDDLKTAPLWARDSELWLSLQQTRHSRAIGRFSPFATTILLSRLRIFESALNLKYEGASFAVRVLLTKQIEWVANNPHLDFVRFPQPLPLSKALFEEKWCRALGSDGDIVLTSFGLGQNDVIGAFSVKDHARSSRTLIAPHESLEPLMSSVVPGTMAMVASSVGDIHLMLPNAATFVKSQGYWSLLNLSSLEETLNQILDPIASKAISRLVFDLSYERRGALICVLEITEKIVELVPDHRSKNRPNRPLRETSRRLNAAVEGHRRMLKNIAAIDGAMVMDVHGKVIDGACMISDPSDEELRSNGLLSRERFPGARSTAAWNASIFGLALKVSEDGPVTVYRKGKRVLQIG